MIIYLSIMKIFYYQPDRLDIHYYAFTVAKSTCNFVID